MEKIDVQAWLARAQQAAAGKAADNSTSDAAYFTNHDGKHPIRLFNAVHPLSEAEKQPGESGQARIFNMSWIHDDNGKKMFLVFPSAYVDKGSPNHPILNFINKVTSFQYYKVKSTNKSLKKYYYANEDTASVQVGGHTYTLKSIFNNVFTGGEATYAKKVPSWFGVERYIANAIDRSTGKVVLLTMKTSASGKPTFFPAFSFKPLMYEMIGQCGDPSDYDVLTKYQKLSENDEFPTLKLLNATNLKLQGLLDAETAALTKDTPLTEEEQKLPFYDIDKLYLTSTKEMARRLGSTIKAFDQLAGTSFYDELIAYGKAHGEDMTFKPAENKSAEGTAQAAQAETAVTEEAIAPAFTTPASASAPTATPAQPAAVVAQQPAVEPVAQPVVAASKEPAMTMCFNCGEIYDLNATTKCPKCGASN